MDVKALDPHFDQTEEAAPFLTGVLPGHHYDELAAVGLGRFRDTDDWTSEAK